MAYDVENLSIVLSFLWLVYTKYLPPVRLFVENIIWLKVKTCKRFCIFPMKNVLTRANFLGKTQINLIGRFLRFVTDFSLHIKLAYSRL